MICMSFLAACNSNDDSNNDQNLIFSNDTPVVIQDADFNNNVLDPVTIPGVTTSSITVNRTGTIAEPWKVNIHLDLSAVYASQHTVELFSPSGASIKLAERISASYVAGNIVTFNSGAVGTIPAQQYPIVTGTYLPSSGLIGPHQNNLASFLEGKEIDGEWTLKITDHSGDDDNNSENEKINGWKLEFESGVFE